MSEKKNIEVVSGDGSSLDISPVYDHLNVAKPKSTKKPTDIVIPKEANKESKDKKDENKEKKEEN